MALLEATNLSKAFAGPSGRVLALSGVCLSVEPGEIVTIRGPSGCGKTTLLLTLGGLLRPSAGTVNILGRDVYGLSAEQRCRLRAERIGFVFQQFHLVPYLSVLENVMVPALARAAAPDAKCRALELLHRLGLKARAAHVPADLSTGERQRAALARAMLNRPPLLLADEPTGNLDDENARAVAGHLSEFAAAGGAVVVATHDRCAWGCATRRFVMAGGGLSSATASDAGTA